MNWCQWANVKSAIRHIEVWKPRVAGRGGMCPYIPALRRLGPTCAAQWDASFKQQQKAGEIA